MDELVPTTEALHTRIDQLEDVLLSQPEILVDLPLVHRFTPGMYIREIFNPAGALITTYVHKFEHPFALIKGSISTFVPEDGGKVEYLTAPHIGITKAGTRRVIYAHEDAVFVTFHVNPDDCQDIDTLEDRLVEKSRLLESGMTVNQTYKKLLKEREDSHLISDRV